MKKLLLKYLATLAALTLACNAITGFASTPMPTLTPAPEILHFENDFVSFDYPAGMVVFNAGDPTFIPYPSEVQLGGQMIAGLADPAEISTNGTLHRTLGIFRQSTPPDSTLEKVMETVYTPIQRKTGYLDATGPVTLAGLPAYQQTYSYFNSGNQSPYEIRDIWVEKDGILIRVSIWTLFHNPENLAAFQSLADQILNSLVIKADLPPIVETPTPEPTPSPTPIPASMLLHFENAVVAFDYLKGLTLYSNNNPAFVCYPVIDFGGEMVVGLGDPRFLDFDTYFRSIRITRRPIPPGSNLEAIFLDTYQRAQAKFPQKPGILNANGPVTVAGLAGVQKTYRVNSGEPAYELRDIWLQKGDEILIISIWTDYTNPEDFAAFQAGAEVLLNSLRIK